MVTKIELELDEQTLERAMKLAEARHRTLDELIREIIENLETIEAKKDPFLGMFLDQTDLIDQVLESIMSSRESHTLRQPNE